MREKDRTTLEALSRARPDALDPTRLAGSTRQREDLAELMAAQPARATARPTAGRRRLLVPLVGLAAAVAVGVGAVGVGIGQHRGTQTTQSAGPDGHLVLLSMADSVRNQATQGDYWQFETQDQYLSIAPAAGSAAGQPFVIADVSETDWSIGVKPGEQSQRVSGLNAKRGPWTPQDIRRWQSAGSPATVEIDPGVSKGSGKLEMAVGAGRPYVDHTDYGDAIVALGSKNVNYAYLQQLPGNLNELAMMLNKMYQEDGGTRNTDQPDWMFNQVGNLITFPVSGAVRAAAYRVLAALPGISSLGTVTDPLGRTGVGVALPPQQMGDLGQEQQQLIVDPATSTILSQQTVLVAPSRFAASAGMRPGTVIDYQATTHIGWTDQQADGPR